jgi:anti-sigma regulatory factor (Ser/Thr protein kinase)
MTGARSRGEEVRRFMLEQLERHPKDLSRITAAHFGISRQAVHKHLQRLRPKHAILETGQTRNRTYALGALLGWKELYGIAPGLAEDQVWREAIRKSLGELPENVVDLWHYGFTEMFNNAVHHSSGTQIYVQLKRTAVSTEMLLMDNGVGIFKKIQIALNLLDERHAILELAKGKLTTDPKGHTGEGIFFSSRMFDQFDILSGEECFSRKFGSLADWGLERERFKSGTLVWMKLNNHASRTTAKVFAQYTTGTDFGFTKTIIPVNLARYGEENLITRSQAKRLLARVESFKAAAFDFSGVPMIGQAFADEIFRVFAQAHPQVELVAVHAASEVKRMIDRAKSGAAPS